MGPAYIKVVGHQWNSFRMGPCSCRTKVGVHGPIIGLTGIMIYAHNIYRAQEEDLPRRHTIARMGDNFAHDGVFAEEVEMGLSCTAYGLPETFNFDGLLMDEEGMLGYNVRIWFGMVSHP